MNDKELHRANSNEESINIDWKFCPICGAQLPSIKNLKFCTVCGTDIKYIKDKKKLRSSYTFNPNESPLHYSQNKISSNINVPIIITDDNLIDNKEHKLWSTTASIGLPVAALFIFNGLAGVFLTIIMVISFDLATSSYFISFLSIFELIFLVLPLTYVGRYLQNPTFKNRLILLGFTTRGFDKRRISKEILIGLGFALIGVSAVILVSFSIEAILELFFGIIVVQDSTGLTGIIIPPDLTSVIVFSVILLLVIGTSEEVLFRGFMQKGLVRTLGDKWGIIFTALIFSLIHLLGLFLIALESLYLFIISFLISFTPYFVISLILGWLYHWRNENLIAVMITHGVYDVLIIVITFLIYGIL
ncbi:MAG: CPBP family glutamic-type intramembrane protease [Promethearchaeota archaeon]|jgi:membrane protease YdiL (CAAX protease family)